MKRWAVAVVCGILFADALAAVAASTGTAARPPVPAASLPNKDTITLSLSLYRILGNISGEMSLTDDIWPPAERVKAETAKDSFSFFTLANMTFGSATLTRKRLFGLGSFTHTIDLGVKFEASERGWTWNGEEQPPAGGKVHKLVAPRVAVLPGQCFVIQVGSERPIEHFVKRPDGLFELRKTAFDGLITSATADLADSGRVVLRNLTIRLQTVEARTPLEGVSLDVGPPLIKSHEIVTTICVQPGRDYGALVTLGGYGSLLLRLHVDVLKPA